MSLAHSFSASDLAKVVGIDERTVRKLEAKKVLRRGPSGGFDLADNVQAYVAHREGVTAAQHGQGAYGKARAALTLERARVMRLRREELEGRLAPLTEMRTVMEAIFSVVRNRVMAIGPKTAPRLVMLPNAAAAQAIVSAEAREALEQLSRAEIRATRKRRGSNHDDIVA